MTTTPERKRERERENDKREHLLVLVAIAESENFTRRVSGEEGDLRRRATELRFELFRRKQSPRRVKMTCAEV